MSRFLITALTLSSTIMSTFAQNAIGAYSQVKSGTCGSVITDKATCENAARSVGFIDTTAEEKSVYWLPPGCSMHAGTWECGPGLFCSDELYYNTDSSSTTSCGSTDVSCICQSCDSTVSSSCDGCGSDGMCNTCNPDNYGDKQMVNAAKIGCTAFKAAIGEKCASSSDCVDSNMCASDSSWTGSEPQIKRCCNADVDYTCDGCGSNGKCNKCGSNGNGKSNIVSSDGTGCNSGSSGGGGGGSMQMYGTETGVIAGGLVGMVVLIFIGIGVGIVLSKKPIGAKMCLCCSRDAALVANIVTFSVMLIMFLICLSQTTIGLLISLSAAMGGRSMMGVHMLYVTVPVLCGCAEVVFALGALGMNRLKLSVFAKVLFSFAIIVGLGLIGISMYMFIAVGGQYMTYGMPGYGLYLLL